MVGQPGNIFCRHHHADALVLPDLVQRKYWVTGIAFSNLSEEM